MMVYAGSPQLRGHAWRVYLNGVEQKLVLGVDVEAGKIEVCQTRGGSCFLVDGEIAREFKFGRVELERIDSQEPTK